MAGALERPPRMTGEEFLAFEGEPDVRYELVDGEVRALAPPSDVHGLMVMNVGHVLRQRRARAALPTAGGCRHPGRGGGL